MAFLNLIAQARAEGRAFVDEASAKRVLAAFGISVPKGIVLHSPEEIDAALAGLARPLVAKLVSPDAAHKSDIGAVMLGLASPCEAEDAFAALKLVARDHQVRFGGVLFEEMAPRGVELMIGGVIDARFGPVVMLGAGGIFVEVFRDVTTRLCPVERIDAAEMIEDLRISPLLRGIRGRPPVSQESVIDTLLAVGGAGGLLEQLQNEVSEIDINPLIAGTNGSVACDARLILHQDIHERAST
jgi:acetate---CoA ligase (ADP-forming) subunit beta